MKKNMIRSAVVLAIIAVVFTVIAFLLPMPKNGTFWTALIFGILSIGLQGFALWMGFSSGDSPRSRFYGFPIAQIGTTYMVVQLITSLILTVLARWIPAAVTVILCIVGLAVAAIGLIAADVMREEIQHQDSKLAKDVSLMRSLQSRTRALAAQWNDSAMAKLAEDLQYSDPVSSPALLAIECELEDIINELQTAVLDDDITSANTLCKKASITLSERNRLCKLNKS